MKKLMFGIAGIMAVLSSANAVDTATIKAACQNSDKTLWVERNQVCIPRNPCDNYKYEQYCNKDFKDVETDGIGYQVLIDLYARTHNLSCKPVAQKAKLVGQDYVVCMGYDVMVFEFDDIRDHPIIKNNDNLYKWSGALCLAAGEGEFQRPSETAYACYYISESVCELINTVAAEYGFLDVFAEYKIANWNSEYSWCELFEANYVGEHTVDGNARF